VVAVAVVADGLADGLPLTDSAAELDDEPLPLPLPLDELSGTPPAGVVLDAPPAGVALAGALTLAAALVCERRCVDAGTAPVVLAFTDDVGLGALLEAAAEVWSASIDPLVAAPSTGRPLSVDGDAAGWP
jgi:hypothetical protein